MQHFPGVRLGRSSKNEYRDGGGRQFILSAAASSTSHEPFDELDGFRNDDEEHD